MVILIEQNSLKSALKNLNQAQINSIYVIYTCNITEQFISLIVDHL